MQTQMFVLCLSIPQREMQHYSIRRVGTTIGTLFLDVGFI